MAPSQVPSARLAGPAEVAARRARRLVRTMDLRRDEMIEEGDRAGEADVEEEVEGVVEAESGVEEDGGATEPGGYIPPCHHYCSCPRHLDLLFWPTEQPVLCY